MSRAALLERGQVIANRYRIESALGQGGMAVVYRAHHLGTAKPCAVKLLQGRWLDDADLLDRFLKEARIIGRIGAHPNIVDVFDAGVDEQRELPYIAMELLSGETLSRYLERWAPLPHDEARSILSQLASALDEAHAAGVIHRDLKPANVFVVRDSSEQPLVKVLDFGIAKETEHSGTATMIGTPTCSAPEQLGGAMRELAAERGISIAKGVSPQTDVWALGLLAYQIFTGLGARQYWGVDHSSDVMVVVAMGKRPRPSERAGGRARHLPARFDAWFSRCTCSDASDRWPSTSAAVAALFARSDGATEEGDDEGRPSGVRVQAEGLAKPAGRSPGPQGLTQVTPQRREPLPAARGRTDSTAVESAIFAEGALAEAASAATGTVAAGAEAMAARSGGRSAAARRAAWLAAAAAVTAALGIAVGSASGERPAWARAALSDPVLAAAKAATAAHDTAAHDTAAHDTAAHDTAAHDTAAHEHPQPALSGSAPPEASVQGRQDDDVAATARRPPAPPPAGPPAAKKDDFDVLFGKR